MFTDFTTETSSAALPQAAPPPGCAADWTIPQEWERFTDAEHGVWDHLFARQQQLLRGRVVQDFAEGLDVLRLSRPGIPRLDELNSRLFARTGWTIVAVPGLVPDDIFFAHLAARRFPAGNFIRPPAQLDYLEQPDIFHDLFGHVPMLAQPAVAEFMQGLGQLGLDALARGELHRLSRLYWYTVEFGLAREQGELRIYGAGIASSFAESRFALDDPKPRRPDFDLRRVLRTRYRNDAIQPCYFVIPGFDALLRSLEGVDLPALYAEFAACEDLDPEMA